MNYIEGFYEGDSTKLLRAVRPEVYKYGYYRAPDSTAYRLDADDVNWQSTLRRR